MKQKLVVGLTGGIGSGKSTVSALFAKLGADIIDTDLIARDLVKPGTACLEKIMEHFGKSCVDKEGKLRRDVLRKKIFSNPAEKQWLENLLHPLIREQMRNRIQVSEAPYIIAVIPLLFETGPNDMLRQILVVDTDTQSQIQRVVARDTISEQQAQQIINSQVSRETRLQGADNVIDNTGGEDKLKAQVQKLHEKYLITKA